MKANRANPSTGHQRILIIDDDSGIRECIELLLQQAGYRTVTAPTGKEGVEKACVETFDLVLTDLRLPDTTGLDVIESLKQMPEPPSIILMTSFSSVESAVRALRLGAVDYIMKPFHNDDLKFAVERALSERRLRKENTMLRKSLKKVFAANRIVGESEGIKRLHELVKRVASCDANVLIQGESGTGKELVAQAIHAASHRAEGPFVPVNCGAIPHELMESELFGHVKGAFTGASSSVEGLIQEASGGTLFLDEISELPLNLQVKLLRVLQDKQVRPVGAKKSAHADVRFLAASNRNLKSAVDAGQFRADLYYRLNVINLQIPALRERGDDVRILADYFVQQHSRQMGKRITSMSSEMKEFIASYPWPGNVRELENVIERAVILAEGDVLTCQDVFDNLMGSDQQAAGGRGAVLGPASVGEEALEDRLSIEEYSRRFVERHQDAHSELELAAMLGIGRKALWLRRRDWGLYRADSKPERSKEPARFAEAAPRLR
jgi:DNA-binding NtrC family response regulator